MQYVVAELLISTINSIRELLECLIVVFIFSGIRVSECVAVPWDCILRSLNNTVLIYLLDCSQFKKYN